MKEKLLKNASYALIAQGISLFVSCMTNLILPKVMGVEDYSYWQLFIFYATYIPCLAMGINDGVYLRYGGQDRQELNYSEIKSQYAFGLVYQFVLALFVGGVAFFSFEDQYRKIIMIFVGIYYLVYTAHNFLGYIFQAINETDLYSKSIILNKVFYLLTQIGFVLLDAAKVFRLIPFYIFAQFLAWIYLFVHIYKEFKATKIDWNVGRAEAIESIRVGISLMISNVCSMLVLGIGRQLIDMHWGLMVFGKISFAFTLINFALTFISQISMVLFPVLRKIKNEELKVYYRKLTEILYCYLPMIYILYYPLSFILKLWLPEYRESVEWMAFVLPICFFDCKMNLIGNTFFKVLYWQKELLKINIITILISAVSGIISIVFFDSLKMVVFGMVLSIVFRSVLAEYILDRYIGENTIWEMMEDIVLAVIFWSCSNFIQTINVVVILSVCALIRFVRIKKGKIRR